MKLSAKSDYALRVLFTLVEYYHGDSGKPVPIRLLAQRNDVPKRFLEQIMIEMREQGWVKSVAGRDGGYLLARSPEQITMGQIVRHFDGILAPIACVSASHYQRCSQEPVCRFRRVLLNIRNYVTTLMDRSTLAAVFTNAPVTRADVFDDPMVGGAGI